MQRMWCCCHACSVSTSNKLRNQMIDLHEIWRIRNTPITFCTPCTLQGLPTNIPSLLRVDEASCVYIVQLYTQITPKEMWQQITRIRGDQIWTWIILRRIAFYNSIRKALPPNPKIAVELVALLLHMREVLHKYRPEDGQTDWHISWLSSVFSRQVPSFKLGHDRFSKSFPIYYSYPSAQCRPTYK